MRKKLLQSALAIALSATAFSSQAFQRNDIPSCYDYAKLSEHKTEIAERELFIIVDQTVRLDDNMKKNIHAQLQNFGKAGDKITLVTFSAILQGEYTNIPFTGMFENLPPQSVADNLNAVKLRKLKSCLTKQQSALNAVHKSLKDSFNDRQDNYPKTELVGTVLSLGSDLIQHSNAKRKVVLLASDMLENSASLTFYSKGSVKVPDAEQAFNSIMQQGFESNFQNAEVHIIGAGYIHGGKSYNSQRSMNQLEKFWRMVFENANADLKQFGKPNMLTYIN